MKLLLLILSLAFGLTSSHTIQAKDSSLKNFSLKNKQDTFYPTTFLSSRFSSWGIDPENGLASINLHNAWKKFKKRKDVVVAVIDTGIQYSHPFLKDLA